MIRSFILLLATAGVVAVSAPSAAAAQGHCRFDDLACRVARLETGIERLTARLEAAERAAATPAREPRSIDVPTDQTCGGRVCAEMAARTCRDSGFPRGVPAEIAPQGGGLNRMTRITCMD